ncbi:DNA helicase RecQ [Paradesertivirga mongoliensis]|uniref:DNA helicase RecQ n=1 Tax=Paradesertivirga mongoliensis TaxID=2100740 RepID=A0ABW4ZLN9_9SPHI|nr:DNA helicase RecQ [Pedobacter mongoliensis]
MPSSASQILKKYFGYDSFRDKQEEIIRQVVSGRDVLVLMPTGGGKSVCYQIPALMLDGVCIVISPLISLMKDQVDALKANGIAAAFLNSSQSPEEQQAILEACYKNEIGLLYVSPEKLVSDLQMITQMARPSMFAIDEAHCISSWGHDFRPEYTQLGMLRKKFSHVPFIALTATADKVTRKDILKQLKLNSPGVFISSFDRKNLSLDVRTGVKTKEKLQEIAAFIDKREDQSGIIYCLSRNNCQDVAEALKNYGINAGYYHAGMNGDARAKVQEDFINDKLQVVCATIAFGMGIDKSNVRWVIHYNLPKNMEGYYQEIGRAGRDGLPSETILYYNYADLTMLNKFAAQSAQSEINLEKLKRIQHYAEADFCRRKILLNYFSESLDDNCGNCDVCKNPRKHFDGTVLVQKALSAIYRMGEKEGANMVIDVLRGSRKAEILQAGYDTLKTHGAGAEIGAIDWQRYLMQMLNLGIIEMAYDEGFALKITPSGQDVLFGRKTVELTVLQPLVKVEKQIPQKRTARSVKPDEELFSRLKQIRLRFAAQEDVPAYIIFSDAVLQEMVKEKPLTQEEMLLISGVGEHKMYKYGQAFLDTISSFLDGSNSKKPKADTYQDTLELLKAGMSPAQVSEKRGLHETTIYSHIAHLYINKKIGSITSLVSDDEVRIVQRAIEVIGETKALKPVFDHLQEQVPYHKIRLAMAVLERRKMVVD